MLSCLIALTLSLSISSPVSPTPAAGAPRLLSQPAIHGSTIVFSYASDLWSWDLDGHSPAVRLTSGYGPKTSPFISPDGKTIAFNAQYDGSYSVYTIPITGGAPRRITYDTTADIVLGWTPDGRIAYSCYNVNPHSGRQASLMFARPDGSLPEPSPIKEITWGSFFPDGNSIAYTRIGSQRFNWRRYRGGSQGVVSFYNFKTGSYSELPHDREQSYYPMVVGKDIYYVSDKGDGILNLYRCQLSTKNVTKLTQFKKWDIKWANTDGKRIVFTEDGYLWLYDIKTGDCHTVSPVIHTDELLTRPRLLSLGASIKDISLSPSGARIAASARGKLFSIPRKSGITRNQTADPTARDKDPEWSPDGTQIAYISDVSGETEIYSMPQEGLAPGSKPRQLSHFGKTILSYKWSPNGKLMSVMALDFSVYVLDLKTGKATKVAQPDYSAADVAWSPDSKWLAITEYKETNTSSLHLYNVLSGKDYKITGAQYQNTAVAFDDSGKYLYMISARSVHPTPGINRPSLKIEHPYKVYVLPLAKSTMDPTFPKEDEESEGKKDGKSGSSADVKVDIDGLGGRLIELPLPADDYTQLYPADNGVFIQDARRLLFYSNSSRQAQTVISGPISKVSFSRDRSLTAYESNGTLGVVSSFGPPSNVGAGAVQTGDVSAVIDPPTEWHEIYWEAWRYIRDNYYDANFRGQDWKAIGDHFAEYLKWARSRSDLNVILGLLLSQLGTSHCYIEKAGDLGPMPQAVQIGYLGADYKVKDGHIQFAKVYPGLSYIPTLIGPLARPGVNIQAGDYLLAINGRPVGTQNPSEMLVGMEGRQVAITVNSKPTFEGARTVTVWPTNSEINLRYEAWLKKEKDTVTRLSGGRIGYMHLRDTDMQGSEDFARAFMPQTDKQALIIDERWNGGGYPDPMFIEKLAFKTYSMGQNRIGGDLQITPSIMGPEAMLINGYAGSGGDLLPWTFRQAKLGPLIGMRTWGGLVGIGPGADLVDGGSISTPSFAVYNPKTNAIIAENHGVDPDIQVDARPDLVAKGEDPQLLAAIHYLLKELDKIGPPKTRTELPHVSKEGHRDLPPNRPGH